ncbi:MAG: YaaA family protein, partial [Muribaculaceae bacterium]
RIDVKRTGNIPFHTQPVFQQQANDIMLQLTMMPVDEISKMLATSPILSMKAKAWAYDFLSPDSHSKEAILAYWGVAYRSLRANDFSRDDFDYAQQHLRIGSGNYGLLRPLDLIKPYRMEFYTRLEGFGNNMQSYWNKNITDELLLALNDDEEHILLNVSSKETFSSFDAKRISTVARIITIAFLKVTANGLKSVSPVMAKTARGAFVRYFLKNRISNVKDLYSFSECGMSWYRSGTNDETIAFVHEDI